MSQQESRDELAGWKQIAGYLGVSVPTARHYMRELGLPVHRRGSRRYFAYRSELDEWRHDASQPPESSSKTRPASTLGDESARVAKSTLSKIVLLLAAISILTLSCLLWTHWRSPPIPSIVRVTGDRLQVLSIGGKLLWERAFPGLEPELKEHIYYVRDVDGDDQREIFFNFRPSEEAALTSRIFCFEADGQIRWEFAFGRELTIGDRYFEPFFIPAYIRFLRANDREFLLVVSRHLTWYPTQVALLDPSSGELISEYWHPGYIEAMAQFDVGEDGREELLLGGINNPGPGLGHPSLVVLNLPFDSPRSTDPPNFFGPQNTKEYRYLLFEHIEPFQPHRLMGMIREIQIHKPDRLLLKLGVNGHLLMLYLDSSLNIVDSRASDDLLAFHDSLFAQGLLDHAYNTTELESWSKFVSFLTAPDGNSRETHRLFESFPE